MGDVGTSCEASFVSLFDCGIGLRFNPLERATVYDAWRQMYHVQQTFRGR